MHKIEKKQLRAAWVTSIALACGMGVSCTEEAQAPSDDSVASSYNALAVQLQNCGNDALDCVGAANCDDAAEQLCRDQFHECRDNTRDAYRAYHEAVRACWQEKLECVREAWGDGGFTPAEGDAGTPFDACKDRFRACVAVDRPLPAEPGPCMSGLRACVEANVEWGEDGSRQALRDCLSETHTCIRDRIPMCGPDEPPSDDDAGAEDGDDGPGDGQRGDFGRRGR